MKNYLLDSTVVALHYYSQWVTASPDPQKNLLRYGTVNKLVLCPVACVAVSWSTATIAVMVLWENAET
uniref:Uncharacterized protein n=1 Tax=Octopus bimaculoides TaxID=37653 RepID=A0A0L8GH36_OCTBM